MKQNETMLSIRDNNEFELRKLENDIRENADTPLREDAFELDDDTKIELIQKHFKEIMLILGLDLEDDSLKDTPKRVAKMYVKETMSGLNPKNKPEVTVFDNKYEYEEMVVIKDITYFSLCEHHFVPFFGKAHVAYFPKSKVPGLSKINRLVQFFARRPQVQERLTNQVAYELAELLGTDDIAVIMEGTHLCVASRGVEDTGSCTTTSRFLGKFNNPDVRRQFRESVK